MKSTTFTLFSALSLLLISASLCFAQTPPLRTQVDAKAATPAALPKYTLKIQELANSQTYRYGREMFLRGNYNEAARIFLEMLRVDCQSQSARYHLEKIADKAPALSFLREKLKNATCGANGLKQEDYVPASAYYEDDPALLLELLLASHKKNRLSEQDMTARLEHYGALTKDLETTIKAMKQEGVNDLSTPSGRDLIQRFEKTRALATQIEKEVVLLQNQLASERLQRQKEVQDLRTRVSEAEAQSARDIRDTADGPGLTGAAPRAYSPAALELINATEKAKAQLQAKETELAGHEKSGAVLQGRLNDVQDRLKAVQSNLHDNRQP